MFESARNSFHKMPTLYVPLKIARVIEEKLAISTLKRSKISVNLSYVSFLVFYPIECLFTKFTFELCIVVNGFQMFVPRVLICEGLLTNGTNIVYFWPRVKFFLVNSVKCLVFKLQIATGALLLEPFLVNILVMCEKSIRTVETFRAIFARILLLNLRNFANLLQGLFLFLVHISVLLQKYLVCL